MFIKLVFIGIKVAIIIFLAMHPIGVDGRSYGQIQIGNDKYSWQPHPSQPNEYMLTKCDGHQCRHIGSYSGNDDLYRPFDGAKFGEPCEPPVPLPDFARPPRRPGPHAPDPLPEPKPVNPPTPGPKPGSDANNFGINSDALKLYSKTTKNSINGNPASREEVDARLNKITDDSGKPYLTLIGPKIECDAVRKDISENPVLGDVKAKWRIKDYRPDAKMLAGDGFVTTGKPTIYFQATDGTVLHRQDSYTTADQLAQVAKLAHPDYDPAKDPDATKPAPSNTPNSIIEKLKLIPAYVYAIAGGLLAFAFVRKKPAA